MMVVAGGLIGLSRPTSASKSIYNETAFHGLWMIRTGNAKPVWYIGFPFDAIILDENGGVIGWRDEPLGMDLLLNVSVLLLCVLYAESLVRRRARRRAQQAQGEEEGRRG